MPQAMDAVRLSAYGSEPLPSPLADQKTEADLPRSNPASGAEQPPPTTKGSVIIYQITDRTNGKSYVGITSTSLEIRIRRHLHDARRRTPRDDRGLLHQLRARVRRPEDFWREFAVHELGQASSLAQARWLEAAWIDHLASKAPLGYNLMPGGASVGGPANARPLRLSVGRETLTFASIRQALAYANERLLAQGAAAVSLSTVYARIVAGWSPAESLGLDLHRDGRSERSLFEVAGQRFTSTVEASRSLGVSASAVRSRIWRATQAGHEVPDIGTDRRLGGRSSLLGLRHPETGQVVTAREFARAVGLPVSTIIYRARKFGSLDAERLTQPTDRRKLVRLVFDEGAASRVATEK